MHISLDSRCNVFAFNLLPNIGVPPNIVFRLNGSSCINISAGIFGTLPNTNTNTHRVMFFMPVFMSFLFFPFLNIMYRDHGRITCIGLECTNKVYTFRIYSPTKCLLLLTLYTFYALVHAKWLIVLNCNAFPRICIDLYRNTAATF